MTLSGGMKRRVMIAKALSHEPQILFLDEPTAGVDVTLRQDMWNVGARLRDSGVTIILTTHYIEEAEEMADRIGVINGGEIILVEDKAELMRKLGKKQLMLHLQKKLDALPEALAAHHLTLSDDGNGLVVRLRHPGRAHRRHHVVERAQRAPTSGSAICIPRRARWNMFVGLVSEANKSSAALRSTASRWRAPGARSGRAWCRRCSRHSLYFVVFGAAIGSRITRDRGRQLRRLYRAAG